MREEWSFVYRKNLKKRAFEQIGMGKKLTY